MIRQFDVCPNPSRRGTAERPYVVVVQSRFLDAFRNRACVPLIAKDFLKPIPRLNPVIRIGERDLYFHPVEITNIPLHLLRDPIGNLEPHRDKIIAALDLVFTGI